jgi:hypothetical protein
MSALLNHNAIPYIPWKSVPYNQLTTSIQKNKNTDGGNEFREYFRPGPLKLYRREIAANVSADNACSRISYSIDEFTRPNGYVITNNTSEGLANTLDMQTPNSRTEHNTCTNAVSSKTAIPCNALRRCRSSGMIRKKYDPERNDSAYFTNTNQYLVSRLKTFKQNQYAQVRYEDMSLLSPPTNGNGKFYIPNGLNHCPKTYYDRTVNAFSYIWIDGTTHAVDVPAGYYDIHELNDVFKGVMLANKHYLVHSATNAAVFLLNIAYNTYYDQVELQVYSTANYPISNYISPIGASWSSVLHVPGETIPQFSIANNSFQYVVGFLHGNYPSVVTNPATRNQGFLSNTNHSIRPSYKIVSYKPNNSKFAQDGGVSGSSLIQRKKYDTIQTVAASYNDIFGSQVANALSYGVSEQVYTLKSRLGYPMKKTPIVSKTTGEVKCVLKIPNVATTSANC